MSMSPREDEDKDDTCIRIRVRGADQTVEVYTDELPADYNDVVDVLKAEIAPLDIWLRFATLISTVNGILASDLSSENSNIPQKAAKLMAAGVDIVQEIRFSVGHALERHFGNPRDLHMTSFVSPEDWQRASQQQSTALYYRIRDPSTPDCVEYYRQGLETHFRGILNEIIDALTPETEKLYSDDRRAFDVGRIRILNALAADSVKRAVKCSERSARDDHYTTALSHLTSADRIDNMSELTWVGKGVFYLCQGELDRAKYFFENARKKRKNFPATLGEAAVNFHHGNFEQALDLYSEAIRINPGCGASVRVGLGQCCYELGQMNRARAAMARALELDPQNVQALVGSAILELAIANAGSANAGRQAENAINTISMAYHVDSTNSMVLNHLANHYFWTWSSLKVTVEVVPGSKRATVSSDIREELVPGDLLRIGAGYMTSLGEGGFDGTTLYLSDEYSGPSEASLKLYRKDYRKVVELASHAYENTTAPKIKAESCYLKARVHHAMGSFGEAKLLYTEACNLWPQFPPAQYGMAQMLVYEGDFEGAVKALDAVLVEVPDNQEALVLLGVLYARNKDAVQALAKFKRALELNPSLSDAWIAQAQVLQQDPANHKLALSSYIKGLDGNARTQSANEHPGVTDGSAVETRRAAWTNIAVLHEHLGDLDGAMSAYEQALRQGGSGRRKAPEDGTDSEVLLRITDPANQLFWEWKEVPVVASISTGSRKVRTSSSVGAYVRKGTQVRVGDHFVTTAKGPAKEDGFEVADVPPAGIDGASLEGQLFKKVHKIRVTKDTVSVVFNLALLQEKRGHHEAAQELHKAVLAEHPTYIHSYLRLGIMARDSGQIHEASKWFRQALEVDGENPDIVAYIGNLHMRNSEWGPAQKKFEKILEMAGTRGDRYANLSLGNIYFSNLEDRTKYEKHLLHAANFYHEVLKKDDANAFSAVGLGMVLAEKGTLEQAKDVFARVREVSAEVLGDVWINLAHVYLAQNKHNEAIRLYQNCLKKFHGGRDPSLHIYLAHAFFDARQYDECMGVLLKALHISPNNLQLWYNLALTRETFAVAVLQKEQKGEARTLAEVENAIEDLKGATKLFSWLKGCEPDRTGGVHRHLPYDASKAEKHAKFCFDNIERAAQHLNHEKMKADQQQEVRERHQRALEKLVQQRKQEEEKVKQRMESRALQRAERAKLKQASLTKLQESWTAQAHTALSKPNSSGKRGRGRSQETEHAPEYDTEESGDDANVATNDHDDDTGTADRYADDIISTEKELQPPVRQGNLKDIGLSSSDDSEDDAFGTGEQEGDGSERADEESRIGQKRKRDSDGGTVEEDDAQSVAGKDVAPDDFI